MALSDSFQSGVRIAKDWQENNRTREDRELITQMNRLKANDIIKSMEVDAEVKNFAKVSEFDAKDLDPNHPGYASQLMGIAKTRMRDLSPAAYEKARPMVAQLYDRFDARKQIEAEMDQRGTATDYTAMFGEAPAGISYQDSKFAMKAKTDFGVDPVFAEKDGIRIFDRKGTEALVNGAVIKKERFKGETEGEGAVSKAEVVRDYNEITALGASDVAVGKVIDEHFAKPIQIPESMPKRLTILEFNKAFGHSPFPLKADGQPDYSAAFKMIKDEKLATIKAVAEAGRDPKPAVLRKSVDAFSGASAKASQQASEDAGKISAALEELNDPSKTEGQKVAVAQTMLKLINSAMSGSPDAVGVQEAKVLGSELEMFNATGFFDPSKKMFGRNLPQFIGKMQSMQTILQKSSARSAAAADWSEENNRIPSADDWRQMGVGPKVKNGVLQATDMAAGDAFLKANPQADVKFIQIGGKRYKVEKKP